MALTWEGRIYSRCWQHACEDTHVYYWQPQSPSPAFPSLCSLLLHCDEAQDGDGLPSDSGVCQKIAMMLTRKLSSVKIKVDSERSKGLISSMVDRVKRNRVDVKSREIE